MRFPPALQYTAYDDDVTSFQIMTSKRTTGVMVITICELHLTSHEKKDRCMQGHPEGHGHCFHLLSDTGCRQSFRNDLLVRSPWEHLQLNRLTLEK